MRDKIASIIGIMVATYPDYSVSNEAEVADAIIAALPGMVKDLVWEKADDQFNEICFKSKVDYGVYYVFYGAGTWSWVIEEGIYYDCPDDFESEDLAKAAVNTYRSAQAMKPFGVTL